MVANKLLTMFALLFLVGFIAATSAFDVSDSSMARCEGGCRPFFHRCLNRKQGPDFCRDFVCDYYGKQCQGCQACGSKGYDFTSAIDTAFESSTDLVKREATENEIQCFIVCHHASCRRMCIGANAELPDDLDGALIINEADLVNGTVAIKIEDQDEAQAGEERTCAHWVCAFRSCYYAKCQKGAQAEEVADMATLEIMAGNRDNQTSPEGCRKVCRDDTETMCIMLCTPGPEKGSTDLTRRNCRQNCWGGRCWTVCYPPYAATINDDIEKRAVGTTSDDCNKACNDDPARPMCVMFCTPPAFDVNRDEKRAVYLARRGCRQNCWGGRCWWVCYPPYAALNDGAEDEVASN